ncbi:hypothetical protein BDW22DRAFT_1354670 [Trametopsis cervina]|nr:hypothetical protein BDW22DRAFT_1354670 [Trametopsis cervina]
MSLRLLRRPPLFRCNSAFPLTATPRRFFSGQDSSAEQLPPFNPKSAFKVTQPPNPQWDIGEGLSSASPNAEEWIEDLNQGWKSWDLGETPRR